MRSPPKREGTNEKQTKEISKDILVKLQKKTENFDEILEKEEKKEEINKRIENQKL